ncbi:MAG: cyanophycinase [Gemmataceae bacterium]|nr:cyanophycinase [Gemmata sp.]MDW8196251.1 cyanophycinase [Gemmataceae bacterium]
MGPGLMRRGGWIVVGIWAAVVPAAAAEPPSWDPRGLPGPLVIVGGGRMPAAARDAFVTLAGQTKAKIVVIPTASADADDQNAHPRFLKPWEELQPASVVLLHTRDVQKANSPAFVRPLTEATGVWFSGGDQNRLVAAYRGTLVEKELKKLQARGGVIGGTSAGAAIMSDVMITGGTETAKLGPGFGFLPGFIVDQHFSARRREKRLQGAIAAHPQYVGLGLDEATGIIVRGRLVRVVGEANLTVCLAAGAGRPAAQDTYSAGSLLDLCQLQRAALNRAAKNPFPPAKAPEPVVTNGSLVIVGGGGSTPEIWQQFITQAGGPDALIVVVPTALEDPLPKVCPEERLLKQYGAKNVVILHTRDRQQANDPRFSDVLTKAGGVWFGGGRQWRFVDAYEGTLTHKRFHEVLARGGVIGGSSAGASIQGEYMPRGHPLGNTVMAAEGYERGFGFLPGCAIDQHFFARQRMADMTGLMKKYPQYLGIGIDEATAIVVRGSVAEVIGRGKVAFYDTTRQLPGEKDYEEVWPAEKYDLKQRRKIATPKP